MIRVDIEVRNPSNGEAVGLRGVLVDTGATYTMLPSSVLGELGVRPLATETFELADGSVVDYPCGRVTIALDRGPEATCKVIFGPARRGLVGANTLEKWGVLVDPRNGKLLTRNNPSDTELGGPGPNPVRGKERHGHQIPDDIESRIISLEETRVKIDAAQAMTTKIRQKSFDMLDGLAEKTEFLSGDAAIALLDALDSLIEGSASISDYEAIALFDVARTRVALSVTKGQRTRR